MRLKFRLLLLAMGWVCAVHAQDFHFSQFHVSPMLQNPANTGFFNCSYRFTGIYRNQWRAIGQVPFKTFAGTADMRFTGRRSNKDIGGVGVVFFNDKAGDGDLTHTGVQMAGSFHKNIDQDDAGINYIGAGAMLGFGGGSVDFSKFHFEDQFIAPGNINPQSAEASVNSYSYFDLSAGVEYNWIPESKNNHIQVGVAMFHINQPVKSFRSIDTSRIYRKLLIHASGQARLSPKFELFPKAQFERQGPNMEMMFGSLLRLDLDKMKNDYYGVYFGMFGRLVGDTVKPIAADAITFMTRLDVKQWSFAFSYDVNISSLKLASDSRGGPEFSLIYIGCLKRGNPKAVYCPRF